MIKALWFIIKVGVLAGLAVWIAGRPGTIRLEWLEYTFTVHIGLFLLLALATILLAIFIYNVIRAFTGFPASYRRFRYVRGLEKGGLALTRGLSAVAAGDTKDAVRQAVKARKSLPENEPLPLLLEAQAARLQGDEKRARENFVKLLEHKDGAFLGLRGLLQTALDGEHYGKALALGRKALELHPRQGWILHLVYDLEIQRHHWAEAEKLLKRMEKAGALTPARAREDRMAILLAQAGEARRAGRPDEALKKTRAAVRLEPGFAPAALRLARLYEKKGKTRKALSTLKKAWKTAPHPELIEAWQALLPAEKTKTPLARLKWLETLLAQHPNNKAALKAAGESAMEAALWGEARQYLMRAEQAEADAEIYRSLAALEEREGVNAHRAQDWLEKARQAPPAPVWICRETGRIYEHWQPVAEPHGAFNTMEWRPPVEITAYSKQLSFMQPRAGGDMLDIRGLKAGQS